MYKQRNPISTILITILLLTALLTGCAGAMSPARDNTSVESEGGVSPQEAPPVAGESYSYDRGLDAAQAVERIVIKNGSLEVVVVDPEASMERISAMAKEMGGFVVNANLFQEQLDSGAEVPRATISIRVPAERMDEAMQRIRDESDRPPLTQSSNSDDVTQDYTDLQSRLRNLESAEAQLQEIMGSATKTEDVLAVYNELVRVRSDIEVIKGQIQYYEQSAALSMITASLRANEAVQPLTIGSWQPAGEAKQAIQALINAVKFIANAAIWIIILVLPVLALLGLVFVLPPYLVIRAWRRRNKSRLPAPLPETPETPAPPASQ